MQLIFTISKSLKAYNSSNGLIRANLIFYENLMLIEEKQITAKWILEVSITSQAHSNNL